MVVWKMKTQMLINEPILHKKGINIDLNDKISEVYAVIDNPNLVCKIGNVTNNEVEIQNKASKLGISPAIIDFGKIVMVNTLLLWKKLKVELFQICMIKK